MAANGSINPGIFFLFTSFAWLTTNIGNFTNDYYDAESDVMGRPNAPLASGIISRDLARSILIVEYLISGLLLFFIVLATGSLKLFILGIVPLICTYVYSVPPFKTKDKGAAGPLTISIAYMSITLGGWALASELTLEAIKLGLFLAILMLGIGFSKDFMHIEADRGFSNTPPIAYGVRKTAIIAAISLTFPLIFNKFFIKISARDEFLLVIPLMFAVIAIFFMIKKPEAKNRNIVMSAFLVYLNAVFIIIYSSANMPAALILSIMVSTVISIKTWVAGRRFETIKIKYQKIRHYLIIQL
ncbi:MAG: UbiA family prenyltransferase [Euryarchaeota archaeon]|nr:UbiA family prenyltransferase [Euryarchaeota archaeon]